MKSIIQNEKVCYISGSTVGLEEHHIFYGTANRRLSEKYGLKIWLSAYWHRDYVNGIHFNKELDTKVKKIAQARFEETHTREEFIRIFGRNYL